MPDISHIPTTCKGLLLDLDNTLYAYDPCHGAALHACHAFFSAHAHKMPIDQFQALYQESRAKVKQSNSGTSGSRSRHLYFQVMTETVFGETRVQLSLQMGDLYWNTFLEHMELRPWVLPFLTDVRERAIKIGIITNLESSLQMRKLVRLGIEKTIDYLVTSEEAGVEKPDQKIFALALSKLDMKPDEVIMIGDNQKEDCGGAAGAHIPYIHVDY